MDLSGFAKNHATEIQTVALVVLIMAALSAYSVLKSTKIILHSVFNVLTEIENIIRQQKNLGEIQEVHLSDIITELRKLTYDYDQQDYARRNTPP